ncbi:MAG: sodium:solute symporter family protein [Proteobacteria bacterium]|nr:sodium:solute symporter family protein [Pseudomonadota bacterium]
MEQPLFFQLSWLDGLVFFVILAITYSAAILGRSYFFKTSDHSPLQIILLGRRLTLPLFVATLVATWYGGVLGVTEISYQHGIFNFVTQGVFWYVSYLCIAFFVVPRLRASGAITLPELVRKKFGPRAETVASLFNLSNILPITYIFSCGLLLDALFHIGVMPGAFLGVVIVLGYGLLGGLRSIILSDLIQCVVMVVAVYAVFLLSWHKFGGWGYLKAELPSHYFEITGGQSVGTLLVWGFIAFSTLVDPNFYNRIFAASSDKVARTGILIATVIWLLIDIATTAGGMYAATQLKGAEPSEAYLIYAINLLPPGMKGLFLAGIIAAILSTMDSYLFLASSTVSYDLQKKASNFRLSYAKNLVLVAIISFVLAMFFTSDTPGAQGIKGIWKTFGSYSAGCMLIPMMIGLFSTRHFRDIHFLIATITSAISMTLWRFLCRPYLATIFTPDPQGQNHPLVWVKDIEELYLGLLCGLIVWLITLWQQDSR